MRTLPWFACLAVVFALPTLARAADEAGFKPLFDGKTLNGWVGDPRFWSVEDGAIAGSTDKTRAPQHLPGDREELQELHSQGGVQASQPQLRHPGPQQAPAGVRGPRLPARHRRSKLYRQPLRRGWRGTIAFANEAEVKKIFAPGKWVEYTITCDGPNLTLALNGHVTVRYTEKDPQRGATEGIIALQLHAGPPMKVWFRNIRIRELP